MGGRPLRKSAEGRASGKREQKDLTLRVRVGDTAGVVDREARQWRAWVTSQVSACRPGRRPSWKSEMKGIVDCAENKMGYLESLQLPRVNTRF